jgi:hypothetical protein
MRDENPGPGTGPVAGLQSPADSFAGSRALGWLAGSFRWVICALLFLGVTKNYMDRQLLGVLKAPFSANLAGTRLTTETWFSPFRRHTLLVSLVGRDRKPGDEW